MNRFIDENGLYGEAIGGPIPLGATAVPERPDFRKKWNGAAWVWDLAVFKRELNLKVDTALSTIKAGYPQLETETWDQQEKEARAFLSDPMASTPMIDAIVANSAIQKTDLVSYIIQKADAYAATAGMILGIKRTIVANLDSAPDPSLVDISGPFEQFQN